MKSCGPLWQQNCGYSKEADGACYELLVNATHVMNMTSHKPLVRGRVVVQYAVYNSVFISVLSNFLASSIDKL